ncbi:bifunctional Gfo/Idh/MocA family oxidoreductase/class I SAM-dependent methyltransferase [Kitasatospora aureofaciens]|uniref:bifunctional Gfo/Idh/MocA family oxidoreductase/class I SAM-dependent methyltransferase n=1 Tax=Kitasatospora aureofaciens TaxID=1894 RepID=UPI001C44F12D|nr:bifunctional Gfo/Idh/MocA family oxidoreductase/class I SAM-dependent methyltransferase [Kitasatospora aureofaciens]MBV6697773.1 Gfo/Idh/MocA family oxidoreductase [Kitasatospora aureofaciens]
MTARRLRVVVCGTTFGQFYLAALAALPDEFEIAGVLARGGERSVACARRFGVPLFTDPDALPGDIDLACVVVRSGVMGGAGTDLALRLLKRRIHVLQEQPVHHDDLAACLREARRQGVRYRLGDLYVRLPAVRQFVGAARRLLARRPALYLDAACSVQVAFPLVHLLGEALGGALRPWSMDQLQGTQGPFGLLSGTVGGVPATLRVQNEVDPDDPDNHIHLLHRITLGTAAGSLTLSDPHGPVLWSPRLHIPDAVKDGFDFDGPGTAHLDEPTTTVLGPAEPPCYRDALSRDWPAAIGADLLALRAATFGAPDAERPEQYHLTLARLWQDVTTRLGYPLLRPGQSHKPLPATELKIPTLDDLVRSAADAAEPQAHHVTADRTAAFVHALDEAVLASMLLTFQQRGLLLPDSPGSLPTTADELLTAVAPAHHTLVRRWLTVLTDRGRLTRDGDHYTGRITTDRLSTTQAWDEAAALWKDGLGGAAFVDYLRRNAERLPALLSGEQQAALLLFPEGRTELADAVYRETVTARYLNTAVATAVRLLAESATDRPLRVLEVGAGTGATTEAVVAEVRSGRVDYLFTDVSRFFLGPARDRFKALPWLRHGLYDIDRPPAEQGHSPGSFDVVIAAGVLNNARDADATVRSLAELLTPGGWLLVTEPTREHLEILTSQAFMMTTAHDARLASGTTFLSRTQWLDVLTGAGLREIRTLPPENHPLAPLGQRLFAARTAQE